MARPIRIQYPGAFYHVMNRGLNHTSIFINKRADRTLFKSTLSETVFRWKIKVHAYSLMDNHYHLLLETPLPNLSRAMRHLDGLFTQRLNKRIHRDGPLFRGRFKSRLVQKETYFMELIRYIHLNGVKANLYQDPFQDPHCSHRDYLLPNQKPHWLTTDLGLSFFETSNQLHAFVMKEIPQHLDKKLSDERWQAILGEKEFVNEIKEKLFKEKIPHRSKPQERLILWNQRPDPKKILHICANYYGVSVEAMTQNNPLAPNAKDARRATMILLREGCQLSYSKIGHLVGGITDSAVEKVFRLRETLMDGRFKQLREKVLPESWRKLG